MTVKVIAQNRKAFHDYTILRTVEAGIALTGTEIKSIREGRVNLGEAYAKDEKGEMWLLNAHIAPFSGGNRWNHDPLRPRKLLLHKDELVELAATVAQKGLTLIPLKLYMKDNHAKIELALAKGKRLYDKREAIAKDDADREMRRAVKERQR